MFVELNVGSLEKYINYNVKFVQKFRELLQTKDVCIFRMFLILS